MTDDLIARARKRAASRNECIGDPDVDEEAEADQFLITELADALEEALCAADVEPPESTPTRCKTCGVDAVYCERCADYGH
jgi:hypothetical protein